MFGVLKIFCDATCCELVDLIFSEKVVDKIIYSTKSTPHLTFMHRTSHLSHLVLLSFCFLTARMSGENDLLWYFYPLLQNP